MAGQDELAQQYAAGRLQARPRAGIRTALQPGEHQADGADGWSGVLWVPEAAAKSASVPVMLALHGAGSRGERMLNRWRETADAAGLVVLAPSSGSTTWDVLRGGYGPDIAAIDSALAYVFDRLPIDPGRVVIEGFSDGASYALSVGLANGDLFTHILANSPGFCWPPSLQGRPRVLLTHGTEDTVLPITATSRVLAPQLDGAGYAVTLHEFEGGHALTPEIMQISLAWAGLAAANPESSAGA